MHRSPARHPRSPGAPHNAGRLPSAASCWPFPGASRGGSPHRGSGHPGSMRGHSGSSPGFSPGSMRGHSGSSPGFSPGSMRGHSGSSPGFSPGSMWGHSGSSPGFSPAFLRGHSGSSPGTPPAWLVGSRGSGGQAWRRSGGFRRHQSFSPSGQQSDVAVEKYFSPAMLEDPWVALQPISTTDTRTP